MATIIMESYSDWKARYGATRTDAVYAEGQYHGGGKTETRLYFSEDGNGIYYAIVEEAGTIEYDQFLADIATGGELDGRITKVSKIVL